MKKGYEKDLEAGRILVYGVAGNEEILQRIGAIYTPERIDQGIGLYQTAKATLNKQNKAKIEATQTTRQFNEIQKSIHGQLVRIRKAGRYFFRSQVELREALALTKEIPTSYATWKALVQETISAISKQEIIQTQFTLTGITPEKVSQLQLAMGQLDVLKLQIEKTGGVAQQATVAKKESYEAFMAYCVDLRACLDLFYEGNERQKLEEVGIVVK